MIKTVKTLCALMLLGGSVASAQKLEVFEGNGFLMEAVATPAPTPTAAKMPPKRPNLAVWNLACVGVQWQNRDKPAGTTAGCENLMKYIDAFYTRNSRNKFSYTPVFASEMKVPYDCNRKNQSLMATNIKAQIKALHPTLKIDALILPQECTGAHAGGGVAHVISTQAMTATHEVGHITHLQHTGVYRKQPDGSFKNDAYADRNSIMGRIISNYITAPQYYWQGWLNTDEYVLWTPETKEYLIKDIAKITDKGGLITVIIPPQYAKGKYVFVSMMRGELKMHHPIYGGNWGGSIKIAEFADEHTDNNFSGLTVKRLRNVGAKAYISITAGDINVPTATPTIKPTTAPTVRPTNTPTVPPTSTPKPTVLPTKSPTTVPTRTATVKPTVPPTVKPTASPTVKPTAKFVDNFAKCTEGIRTLLDKNGENRLPGYFIAKDNEMELFKQLFHALDAENIVAINSILPQLEGKICRTMEQADLIWFDANHKRQFAPFFWRVGKIRVPGKPETYNNPVDPFIIEAPHIGHDGVAHVVKELIQGTRGRLTIISGVHASIGKYGCSEQWVHIGNEERMKDGCVAANPVCADPNYKGHDHWSDGAHNVTTAFYREGAIVRDMYPYVFNLQQHGMGQHGEMDILFQQGTQNQSFTTERVSGARIFGYELTKFLPPHRNFENVPTPVPNPKDPMAHRMYEWSNVTAASIYPKWDEQRYMFRRTGGGGAICVTCSRMNAEGKKGGCMHVELAPEFKGKENLRIEYAKALHRTMDKFVRQIDNKSNSVLPDWVKKVPTPTPTVRPTNVPTTTPTVKPTAAPTALPTKTPTLPPVSTPKPTVQPTKTPTIVPTKTPTVSPTKSPTVKPTASPTVKPTASPTPVPVKIIPDCPEAVDTNSAWAVFGPAIGQFRSYHKATKSEIASGNKLLELMKNSKDNGITVENDMAMMAAANGIRGTLCRVTKPNDSYILLYAKAGVKDYNGPNMIFRETPSSRIVVIGPHDDSDFTHTVTKLATQRTNALATISNGQKRHVDSDSDFMHHSWNLGSRMVWKLNALYPKVVFLHTHGMANPNTVLYRSRSKILGNAYEKAVTSCTGFKSFTPRFNAWYQTETGIKTGFYLKVENPVKFYHNRPGYLECIVKYIEANYTWAYEDVADDAADRLPDVSETDAEAEDEPNETPEE